MSRPLVANRDVALWGGLGLFLAGAVLLHDAFEGRGRDTPWPFRAFTFW